MASDLLAAVQELGLERSTAAVADAVAGRPHAPSERVPSSVNPHSVLDDLEALPTGHRSGSA